METAALAIIVEILDGAGDTDRIVLKAVRLLKGVSYENTEVCPHKH